MKKTVSGFLLLLLFASIFAQKPYKGAEVFSKDKVLYGKFIMHMKMIKASGMLSTFFTIRQGTDQYDGYWAELDIEVLGKNNAEIMSTNIITDGAGGNLVHNTKEIHLEYSLADDYHTYILEWTPDYVAWFIDDVEYRRETGDVIHHLNEPQGYRFNSWISCSPGWVGSIDKEALPQYQYVDWIEYYSYDTTSKDFSYEWSDDFDSFNSSRWAKANWTFYCNEVDFVSENISIQDGKLVLAITDPNPNTSLPEKPADHIFTARYSPGNHEILVNCTENANYITQLFDMTGKLIISKQFNTSSFSIPRSDIPGGLYIISVHNQNHLSRQKIFIE